jgi:hypothetical protein
MTPRRIASLGGAGIVAAIAALASYTHMRGLALRYGQNELIADLLPISVDGMMVVASVALGDGRRHRWSAWLAFWTGIAASVIANVLAAQPTAIARCISAWPAVAFVLVIEVITRGGRERDDPADAATERAGSIKATSPHAPRSKAKPRQLADPVERPVPALIAGNGPASSTQTAAVNGTAAPRPVRSAPQRTTPARHETRGQRKQRPVAETAAIAARIEAEKPGVTPAELAAQLGISTSRLRAIRRETRTRDLVA